MLALVGVVALLLATGGAWLWNSSSGINRLLQQVPGLELQGQTGRPNGGPFAVQRLVWRGAGGQLVIEELAWDDAAWNWRPYPGAWLGIGLERPRAARVQWRSNEPPAAAARTPPPTDLTFPVELRAPGLRIGRLEVGDQAAVIDIAVDLHLGAAEGREHRLQNLALKIQGLDVAGNAVLGSGSGLPLQARATATAPEWQAELQAQGPLQRLQLAVQLGQRLPDASTAGGQRQTKGQAQGRTQGEAQVQATLAPFAAWPLLALAADVKALDLSTLAAGLPQTQLSGRAALADPSAAAAPDSSNGLLALDVQLVNASPGAWDAGLLPLRSLDVRLQGRPAEPGTLVFDRLQAQLEGAREAGVLNGSGRWEAGALALDLRLQAVRPEQLDTRLPPMSLGGQVSARAKGLGNAAAPAPAAGAQPSPSGTVQVELDGRLPRRGAPALRLQAEGVWSMPADGSLALQLRNAVAVAVAGAGTGTGNVQAGGKAEASADARRDAAGAWQLQSAGTLTGFDPGLWWPAAGRDATGQRINARWQADLALPAPPAVPNQSVGRTPPAAPVAGVLDRVLGSARLTLDDSRWAGTAWRGLAELQADAKALALQADLKAGPNQLKAEGRFPRGDGAALPQAQLNITAPQLAALAPLARVLPGAAAWWPQQGAVSGQASAQGRWPAVRSEGTLQARGLLSPQWSLATADANWKLSTVNPDAALSLQLQAGGLAQGERRLSDLRATLQGTLREHSLTVQAASPLRPPAWAESVDAGGSGGSGAGAVPGVNAPGGSRFTLRGSGRWAAASGGGGTWRGTLAELSAAPLNSPQAPWLAAAGVQAAATFAADGGLQQAALEPGRVVAFGSALTWQQAQWQAPARAGAPPRMALQALLEPLQVAPFLARIQPQFGWRGDLAVGGRIAVRSGERFEADINVQRTAGDLSLTVDGNTQALALSDLRLGLVAKDGLWQVTQALVGKNVGVLGGLQTLRTSPQAAWPEPTAPLEGGLSLLVPQLQVWAPWLPLGWQLGGSLRVALSFGGQLRAPEYRGSATGENLSVRNLFEGIALQDGVLDVAMTGTEGRIRKLEFRDGAGASNVGTGSAGAGVAASGIAGSGGGVLRVTGDADFSATPVVQLRAVAEKLRLLDRYDRRITLSGAADLRLAAQRTAVNGRFTIDEGLVDATQADAPSLSADVVVVNRAPLPRPPGVPPPPVRVRAPPGTAQTLAAAPRESPLGAADVDLRVDLGQALRLRGRGLDTLLRGQLRLTTPDGQLAVNGVVRAEQGTYSAYGQNLAIDRGTLTFRGDPGNPVLDILALRADIDTRVGVVVSGSAANPRVRLYSEPELGQLDTLTWLVLGRAPEGLGRDDTALLQRAALALLAGEQGGASSGFLQQLGLDELTLRRGSNDGVGETIISLGKQLSSRVYVGYEQALGRAGGTLLLIYRIAERITLRLRTGEENAIDAVWTWRWN